jgi:hypothetical protein
MYFYFISLDPSSSLAHTSVTSAYEWNSYIYVTLQLYSELCVLFNSGLRKRTTEKMKIVDSTLLQISDALVWPLQSALHSYRNTRSAIKSFDATSKGPSSED